MATLSDMATLVCTELGLFDDTSIAMAKTYLSKNYISIWDRYPWGDANGYGTTEVLAGVSVVDYPADMDRIITVRASQQASGIPPGTPDEPDDPSAPPPVPRDSRFLDPVDSTFLIESEPTIFEDRGYVKYYEEIGDANGRQIRLYPIPTWGTTLFFYGKKICPGLVEDDGGSAIRNIDPALTAYATHDMLRRQRQYGKAQEEYAKAKELEQVAWNLEQQQANQPRKTKATTVAGNSLSEMTDAVCQICGQWTPQYRLMIREFLRRNYQTMYDTFLWPESLVVVRVGFASEQVIMPHYIDKVLGVRGTDNQRMFPADAGLFLDISPSIFEDIGTTVGYTTLTPVGVSTLPPETTGLVFASTSAVDRTKMYVRGQIISTGQELEETVTLAGTVPVQTQYDYDIPITVSKDITLGDVTVNAATDYRLLETIPSYMRELKHQRLWFLPNPDTDALTASGEDSYFCIVLAKVAIHPLVTDQDSPIITGAQQVLIAAAAGDLFRTLEKGDMAAAMLQKAEGSMNVLKAKNTDQAAHAPRFVPQIEARSYVAGCTW